MKYCSKCGEELNEDAVVCLNCGCAVNEETKQAATSKKSVIVLGILGIIFAWLFALAGHVLSIIGLVIGWDEKKKIGRSVGFTLCVVGECCAIVNSVLGVLMTL